ncbi:hypothetical protein GCM10010300_50970 [Streptomyces olivaceoviridis]|nr:hypothetical protein GCM10010300_50970 [Streptomyces olivaceoviridis]
MLRLSLPDAEYGGRCCPASRRRPWPLCGGTRAITPSWPATALAPGRPKLRAEGCDTPPVMVRG